MPIFKSIKFSQNGYLGIWLITETENELFQRLAETPPAMLHPVKRMEWLASRLLLKEILQIPGIPFIGLEKGISGKPYLTNHHAHISLSHSFPYVAVQVDIDQPAGIDIEQPRPKLLKVAPRVFSREEQVDAGQDIIKNCIYWCAKEALYKFYGDGKLHFNSQLLIDPFEIKDEGELSGNIIFQNGVKKNIVLQYIANTEFVLVYTKNGLL